MRGTSQEATIIYLQRMYSPTSLFFLFFWMLTIIVVCTTTAANSSTSGSQFKEDDKDNKDKTESDDTDGFRQLVAWVKQHGGRVADDMFQLEQIKGIDDNGVTTTIRGGVAITNITKGTELLYCPWELILGSTNLQHEHHQMLSQNDMCHVIESIDEELRLGHDSSWYWYLKLHQNDISKMLTMQRLTSFWNQASLQQLQGLPPYEDGNKYLHKTQQECVSSDGQQQHLFLSKFMKQALVLYLTRCSAVGMVPIYDLFNHHNGYRNVKLELLAKNSNDNDNGNRSGGVQLIATQNITIGSQIYDSYGIKSSSSMFRDFGFVESWPQLWVWTDTHRQHTLITLLDNVAVIYPNDDLVQEFRHKTTTSTTTTTTGNMSVLESFQQLGMQYSRNLSRDDLVIFETSARNLLDSLPTTVQDDWGILAEMKRELQLAQQQNNQVNNNKPSPRQVAMILEQTDSISAVEYRIKFKQAVQIGLNTALRILLQQYGQEQTTSTTTTGTHSEL